MNDGRFCGRFDDSDLWLFSRIAPVADKTLSLNIRGGKKEDRNPVQLYNGSAAKTDISSMWYLRLADAAVPNCPGVEKAPTDSNSRM